MAEGQYDFVVFGATGFTGQFVVEELARVAEDESGLSWAIAGRSMAKLQGVLAEASKQTEKKLDELPIIIADVNSAESLAEMCKQSKVVLNCVGPYRFFGEQVVKACVENGASYVDISGEPQFLENMQLKYNKKAKEAGVYIVGACGFDSIPADMGVIFARDQFDGDLNTAEAFLAIKSGPAGGGGHYATWQSAIHGFANAHELISIRKQLFPTPLPRSNHKMKRRPAMFFGNEVNSYCVPFPGSDRSIVNRTQRFNFEVRKERNVQFNAFFRMPSLFSTIVLMFFGILFGVLAKFKFGRTLLEKYPGLFSGGVFSHAGPTREQIKGSSFSMTFICEGYSKKISDPMEQHTEKPDKKMTVRVAGPEIGYDTTPICLTQAALVILQEKEQLPEGGGVLTPGAAFAKTTLIERLQKRNLFFKVLQ